MALNLNFLSHFRVKVFWVSGTWVQNNKCCNIVNIYSSCLISDKKEMWKILAMSKRGFGGEFWCLVGDFNAVKH